MNKEERANAFALRIMDYFFSSNTDTYVTDIESENDVNIERLLQVYNYAYNYFTENIIGD